MAKTPAMLLLLLLLVCQLSGMRLTHYAIKKCDSNNRPTVCPRIWLPVCAKLKDGTKKVITSSCEACRDVNVVEYDDSYSSGFSTGKC
jgi:hypothetical protein